MRVLDDSPLALRNARATVAGACLSRTTAALRLMIACCVSSALTLLTVPVRKAGPLGLRDALLHHEPDVLEAEHVLGVGQDLYLPRGQLAVGGEHVRDVDLARVQRGVAEPDRDRLERRVEP